MLQLGAFHDGMPSGVAPVAYLLAERVQQRLAM